MEITQQQSGDTLVLRLAGRLDAGWSGAVQKQFDAAIRGGGHCISLDLAEVDYISSAGIGALLALFKDLHAIQGQFSICAASPFVESALKLAGLSAFFVQPATPPTSTLDQPEFSRESAQAKYDVYSLPAATFDLKISGDPEGLQTGGTNSESFIFGENAFAFGLGALGSDQAGCEERFGEFLAVGGSAVFQPADGSSRPDFVVQTGDFVPEGRLFLGLAGEGHFSLLARFEGRTATAKVGLSELAETALQLSGGSAVAIAAIAESAGLVGAALRRSPSPRAEESRFDFPQIRDWLAYGNERSFHDSTTLLTGVVARPESRYQTLLRPMGAGLWGHFHAAVFPYRPVQKGRVALGESVGSLFESNQVNAVLHLLNDDRSFSGAGQSEFRRGALWIAPLTGSAEPSTTAGEQAEPARPDLQSATL